MLPSPFLILILCVSFASLRSLQASHVFFLEPLLNPGAEAQAIGRVHRIGQAKKTYVHRFIIGNTIETSIEGFASGGKERKGAAVRGSGGEQSDCVEGEWSSELGDEGEGGEHEFWRSKQSIEEQVSMEEMQAFLLQEEEEEEGEGEG